MNWLKLHKTLAIICMGGLPLATVGSCDYGPGGAALFLDRHVGECDHGGCGYPGGYDVVVEDEYYVEDVYYEDEYYVDGGYYYDDGYCWDCY
jgi:hypothetical protein